MIVTEKRLKNAFKYFCDNMKFRVATSLEDVGAYDLQKYQPGSKPFYRIVRVTENVGCEESTFGLENFTAKELYEMMHFAVRVHRHVTAIDYVP